MGITQSIHLTLDTYKLYPVSHMVQNDTGRNLKMFLDDYTLTGTETAVVAFKRSDATHYTVPATRVSGENAFIADLTQALTQNGITECQLKITESGGKVLSTYTFNVKSQDDTAGLSEEQFGYSVEELHNIVAEAEGCAAQVPAIQASLDEVLGDVGTMSNLFTTDKSSLVAAINEVFTSAGVDGLLYENSKLWLTKDGVIVGDPVTIVSGSGGSDNEAIITVANTTGWLSTTISESEQCVLSLTWSSVENEYPTGDGQLTVRVNGIVKEQQTVQQGEVSFNVREYLSSGTNVVRVTVADVYGNQRTISYTISLVALSISADAFEVSNASSVYDSSVLFTYVPVGAVTKNVVFILDGTIIGTQEVTTSGRQQTFTIPSQSHGAHNFECYFTATVNGATVSSNHLYFALIFVESGNNTPIIATPFNAVGATQYYTLSIPYTVYTPNSSTSEVSFSATIVSDGETTTQNLGTRTVERTQQTFTYTPTKVGTLTLTITSGVTTKNIVLSVASLNIDVEAETDSLELYLSASGRSNAEARPSTWTFNEISCTFTGFNFVSDGWTLDADNATYLKVSGDARLTIPFAIFGTDFKSTGKTIEFDFSTTEVMNYDATIISCMSGGKGLSVTPQMVSLASESTNISTQYKEDEHVRVTFVVEKTSEHRLLYTYINGICSGIVQYPSGDDFEQSTPVDITIGSNECTTNLYTIRVYSNSLTRHQVLNNWIADTPDGATMLSRYNHNNIYDEYGDIVINKLPSNLPYLIIESGALPSYKGDKKTISGSYTNPIDPTKSFTFEGASCDVQGTSSAGYPRKNYKIKFSGGFTNEDGETTSNYYLRGATESLPTNVFCFKADYASSEGANNVELVRLYNDACPYKTEPQDDNSLVRQGIDGIPIVIFWSNTNTGTTSFLGKYNMNFDKSSKVFGFASGDESWETTDNSNDWALFKRADFTGTGWESAFEARYPDDYNNPANLSVVAQWICSTDRTAATGDALAESVTYEGVTYTTDSAAYRLAKFRNELEDYFDLEDVLFYYLFTELFLMVDSRVKNSFPTLYASHEGAKWCWLPYDMDTAIGINNEGALAFDYSLEDTDMVSATAGVYNGYQTVMWNNVRDAFPSELADLYKDVRADGIISYESIEARFENHQNTWNEAIYNEDAYFKYVKPFIDDGENNLYMCFGSKAEQRKWWLYNRFRYIDSKYTAGLATATTLQMRVYQKSNLTVTPYADIYAAALFDSNLVKQKATRGVATTLVSPTNWNPMGSDAVLRIYSADQIKSLGDLSGFYVGAASFAAATKLQDVKLGDSDSNYSNENLTEVTFGANTLLKSVDIRNCPNLTSSIDFSQCTNLETLHLEGTAVTGVTLANGGGIKSLYLPDTVTNLTLRNLAQLENFELNDTSNLTTLWLENIDETLVDGLEVVNDMADGGRVRLVGFNKTYTTSNDFTIAMCKIMKMRGIDASGNNLTDAYLQGEVTVPTIARYVYDNLYRWPYLTVHYDTIGAYDYILHLQNSSQFIEYNDSEITKIRGYAFYNSYLSTINTPNVTSIATYAFKGSKVKVANFPLVTSISGYYAFDGATELTSAYFPIVTYVPDYTFQNCSKLEDLTVNYNIGSVGTAAFKGCAKLTAFATNASAMYGSAFNGCTNLEAVDIGGRMDTTRGDMFTNCSKLKTIVLRRTTVQGSHTVTDWASGGTPFASGGSGGTIYIPKVLYDHLGDGTSLDYKHDSKWSVVDGYGTITWAQIEGSYYETHYADGTEIPQEES